ncbi:MAG TPA: hypothetical protein VNO52_12985 [Methylomirabilota bacterium]|nr:hypothetical protein [Methylomirabilota bacterium]
MRTRLHFSLHLTRHRIGRALLHLSCIVAGGNRRWHWQGIRRELRLIRRQRQEVAT